MKIKLTFALAFICTSVAFAQQNQAFKEQANNTTANNYINNDPNFYNGKFLDTRFEGIKGSPYLFEKWETGEITKINNTVVNTPIKYNVTTKELLILAQNKKDSLLLSSYEVKSFKLMDESQNVLNFIKMQNVPTNVGLLPSTFLLQMYAGEVSLFKHFHKTMKRGDYKEVYGTDTRFDTYNNNNEYFIKKGNSDLTKISTKRKSIVSALKDHQTELEAFIEKEKLDLKSDNDLLKLIKYYNSLKQAQ